MHLTDPSENRQLTILYHLFIIGLCLTHNTVTIEFRFVIVLAAISGIVLNAQYLEKYFFSLYTFSLIACLLFNPYAAANHFYLITYLTLFLAMRSFGLLTSFRYTFYLLILTFAFAGLQKILSHHFMSGALLVNYFLQGNSLGSINAYLFVDMEEMLSIFKYNEFTLASLPPGPIELPIRIGESMKSFSRLITYSIIFTEVALLVLILLMKNQKKYWFLLAFIWATALFRPEFFFFSTLSFLALYDDILKNKIIRGCFKLSIIFFLTLAILNLELPI